MLNSKLTIFSANKKQEGGIFNYFYKSKHLFRTIEKQSFTDFRDIFGCEYLTFKEDTKYMASNWIFSVAKVNEGLYLLIVYTKADKPIIYISNKDESTTSQLT